MHPSTVPAAGEEFRDDLRGTGAAAIELRATDPRTSNAVRRLLPPEVLAELTRLAPWRSSLAIAQTLGLIGLAVGVAWTHFTWWTVLPAVILLGTQQHALFVLAHDAAHYRLFESRTMNEAVGRFVGSAGGVSMLSYRVIHRLHHNPLYGALDPDIALHGGYPRGRACLWRKLLLDAIGVNAFKTFAWLPRLHAELKQRGVLDSAQVRPLRHTFSSVFAPRVPRSG